MRHISISCLLFAVSCQLLAQEAPPSPYRYMLMTDGVEVFPKATLASETQVSSATNKVEVLKAQVAEQQSQVATLLSRVESVEDSVADVSKDGVWVLEGYINSIGVLSGMPEYDGTISIVHMTVTQNADATRHLTLYAAFDPAPVNAQQVAMVGNASLKDEFGEVTYTCSFPTTVPNPKNAADTRAIYTFEADFDGDSGFAKIVSTEGAGVGVGDYLPVTGGLSMNGIQGATATLTADDGTVLKFLGGVLVEDEPIALEE